MITAIIRLIRSEQGVLEGFHGVLHEAHMEEAEVVQDLAEVHHGPDLPNKQYHINYYRSLAKGDMVIRGGRFFGGQRAITARFICL